MFKLLALLLLLNSCSGMQLSMPISMVGNEIGRVGDETGSTRTVTNTQTSVTQKWDNVKNTEVQITQEMKDKHRQGVMDAQRFMKNYKPVKKISLEKSTFNKYNKRLSSCRYEIIWTMKRVWEAGNRYLTVQGHRSAADQAKYNKRGSSQVKISKHNAKPSDAIDIVPIEENTGRAMWGDDKKTRRKDLNEYYYLKGVIKGVFLAGVAIHGWELEYRDGVDWKQKGNTYQKTTLRDVAHWEVVKKCYGGSCEKTLKI